MHVNKSRVMLFLINTSCASSNTCIHLIIFQTIPYSNEDDNSFSYIVCTGTLLKAIITVSPS